MRPTRNVSTKKIEIKIDRYSSPFVPQRPSCLFYQALGKLIRTIGSTLDTDKNTLYVKELFRLMDKIANNKNINSRMRFMIRDLEELRVRSLNIALVFMSFLV